MHARCEKQGHPEYCHYGKRGISVCAEWQAFMPFCFWAMANGYRDDLTLDRIDVNGNYEPSNCRWATQKEQARNRRSNRFVEVGGVRMTCKDWARKLGISSQALLERLNSGNWTEAEAVSIGKGQRTVRQPKFNKPVIQLSLDGEVVAEWQSINDAAKGVNRPASNISRALTNPNYTCAGYKWKYAQAAHDAQTTTGGAS